MAGNRFKQMLKGLTLAAALAAGITAAGDREVLADTLTMTIEKTTIGQGLILAPTQVEFTKGESCADIFVRGCQENGITPIVNWNSSYGFYLVGIKNADSGSANPPACVKRVMSECKTWTGDAMTLTANKSAPDLSEFSYCSASGWTYTLDHDFAGVGMGQNYPSDGDVMRVCFALCGGTDITGKDPYNNNKQIFEAADKTDLIRMMGKANANRSKWSQASGFSSAYSSANSILTTLDASANSVYEATELLKSIESTLPADPKLISLSASELTLTKGDNYTLTYTIVPSDAYNNVTWNSSNSSVASVNGGVITAVGEGTAQITAKASNSVKASCKVTVSAKPVAVTGVSISPSKLNLSTKSASRSLSYTVTPNGAKPSSMVWKSSDTSVATVDSNGKVSPVGAGTATITLTTDNGTQGSCQVTVTAPAEKIELSETSMTIAIDGGKKALTWTFSPQGSGGELTWTSDNEKIAKVDADGVITPVAVGETDIRVKTDQNVKAVCHVIVKAAAKDIFAAGMPAIKTCKESENGVFLEWEVYEGADSYLVLRRKMGESGFSQLAQIDTLSYTDTTAASGNVYYYSVQAVSKQWGKSSYDKNHSVTIEKKEDTVVTVGASSITKVTSADYNKVQLTWSKANNADGYVIYMASSKNGSYQKKATISGADTLTAKISGLTAGKTYYFKVRGVKSAQTGTINGPASAAKAGKAVPKTPSVSVSAGKNKATLKWKKVSGASGYIVYRADSKNGTYKAVATIKKGSTVSYTDKKLTSKKTCYYKVCAYRTVNGKKVLSSASSVKSAKIK